MDSRFYEDDKRKAKIDERRFSLASIEGNALTLSSSFVQGQRMLE